MKRNFVNQGFSLIELVIVIAVLAILSAVAIPSFVGVRNNAKVAAAKNSLVNIIKECMVAEVELGGNPVFGNIASWQTTNSYGDRTGLNFGFTYDTTLTSNTPISANDSCYRVAAKSNTRDINGSQVPLLPHFEIFYDRSDNYKIKKNCAISGAQTINNNFCDPNAPAGERW